MPRSSANANFLLVTVAIVGVILHGSLYPYAFRIPIGTVGPLQTLLGTWGRSPTSFGDLVANILLYVPFGFFAVLAMGDKRSILPVTLMGLMLCIGVELAQFYDIGRVTNMSDIYLNTLGTLLGGIGGNFVGSRMHASPSRDVLGAPIPGILLLALLGYRLFPYVPTIDLHKYWAALKPVVLQPEVVPIPVVHYLAFWLTANYLIAEIARPKISTRVVALFAVFVFGAKILIVNQVLTLSELVGAALAFALWGLIRGTEKLAAAVTVSALVATVVISRLEPFVFHVPAGSFGWVPFRSFMNGSLEINIPSFFEKVFFYGSMIWIGSRSGLSLAKTTALVAIFLFLISAAEVYLPGRSAEITDSVMAVLLGVIFGALDRLPRRVRDGTASVVA